ncbi:MAG: thiamine-phosphate kinase, partial [Bacteroidetes bacterium]|nr:thiamine-phosphate kinase [Bacteroidota bacterium]
HICKNSNVGCKIYSEKIPIDITTCNMANEFNIAPEIAALNGGEDYELLFTVSLKDYEKIKNLKEISVIGNIIDESDGMNLISDDGKQIPITAQGWNGIK